MLILIMRHGQTDYLSSTQALSVYGKDEVKSTSSKIAQKYQLSHIYCSNKLRAIESAQILAEHYPDINIIKDNMLMPEADPMDIMQMLEYEHKDDDVLCLVSHLPLVGILCSKLLEDKSYIPFDTAQCCVLSKEQQAFKFVELIKP